MLARLRFSIALPVVAVLITSALFYWHPTTTPSTQVRTTTLKVWKAVNTPVTFLESACWPMEQIIGSNYALNPRKFIFLAGIVLFWLGVGYAIDKGKAYSAEDPSKGRKHVAAWKVLLFAVLAVVECFLLLVAIKLVSIGIAVPRGYFHDKLFGTDVICGVLLFGWACLLLWLVARNTAMAVHFIQRLFASRPGSPLAAYVLAILSILLLLFIDSETWQLLVLLAICVFQFRFRTLIGWAVLMVWFLQYSMTAAINTHQIPGQHVYNMVFLICGLLPLICLIIWRPRAPVH